VKEYAESRFGGIVGSIVHSGGSSRELHTGPISKDVEALEL
jgi:hypothetical protein